MSADEDEVIKDQWRSDGHQFMARYYDIALLYGEEYAEQWAEKNDARPRCPYCGDYAPYGDERLIWLSAHLDSRTHRWWWSIKRRFGGTR